MSVAQIALGIFLAQFGLAVCGIIIADGFYHATIELLQSISDVVELEWGEEDE